LVKEQGNPVHGHKETPVDIKKTLIGTAFAVLVTLAVPTAALAGNGPADGRCVAQGAGFTFDGPTKAAVARGQVVEGVKMNTVILDHAFNGADTVESLLNITICN